MTATINASTSSGVILTSDTSGNLDLQSNGTSKVSVTSGVTTIASLSVTAYTPTASLLTSGTAVASTSGTSIDFTSIPSWVKRITVMFGGVSTSGVADLFVQIGTVSGVETTGYLAVSDVSAFTSAFGIRTQNATFTVKGAMVITNLTSNTWVMTTNTYIDTGTTSRNGSGSITLAGTLDRVRITTTNGTDTFDAGSINIMYE